MKCWNERRLVYYITVAVENCLASIMILAQLPLLLIYLYYRAYQYQCTVEPDFSTTFSGMDNLLKCTWDERPPA